MTETRGALRLTDGAQPSLAQPSLAQPSLAQPSLEAEAASNEAAGHAAVLACADGAAFNVRLIAAVAKLQERRVRNVIAEEMRFVRRRSRLAEADRASATDEWDLSRRIRDRRTVREFALQVDAYWNPAAVRAQALSRAERLGHDVRKARRAIRAAAEGAAGDVESSCPVRRLQQARLAAALAAAMATAGVAQ